MEVGGIGGGATHADALVKLAGSAQPVEPAFGFPTFLEGQDSVGGLLEQLAAPQISDLIQAIENGREVKGAEPANDLLAKAILATREGDVPRALSTLTDLVHAHPARAEGLAGEPALAPIRTEVNHLLQRITSTARVDAQEKIDSALSSIRSGGHGNPHRLELSQQTVIAVASRLFESGQYANVVLSAGLAQAVIEFYGPFPVAAGSVRLTSGKQTPISGFSSFEGFGRFGERAMTRAARMWREAPLSLMLIVWMLLGVGIGLLAIVLRELSVPWSIAAVFFEVWGVGFLGLIGYGFYRSIRRLRF